MLYIGGQEYSQEALALGEIMQYLQNMDLYGITAQHIANQEKIIEKTESIRLWKLSTRYHGMTSSLSQL